MQPLKVLQSGDRERVPHPLLQIPGLTVLPQYGLGRFHHRVAQHATGLDGPPEKRATRLIG
ncbi:hypothetical protein [Streptomyces sp. NPDC058855]|uniref:hypothetical protein n=1 Tax=Streptomyces sp. NPDC058855 TaxID=3346651 RepID=UPI0036826669